MSQIIEDILLSENNTNLVTTAIIRGIIKSSHTYLHKVLGDFFLAARLQEGVRQVICENMDCGTIEAFFTLFQIITEHDLIRFSAVKRVICTWTGLCNINHVERITNKQLDLIKSSLSSKTFCQALTQSNDSVELYIGLWTLGFYEVQDAIDCCKELIANGTRNQKLVVSYYNIALQHKAYTMPIASQILETYPQDIELCTAFLPTYLPDSEQVLYCACYGKNYNFSNHIYHPISWDTFHLKKEQAKTHFFLWKNIYQMLPKKGYLYSPCIFPWYYVSILPSQAVYYMALFAYMLQEEELIDQVCPLISKIDPSYRDLFLCLLLHHPKTKLQQQTLLQALSDKHYNTRECAFSLIKNLNLEEKDYQQLLLLLKYKSADTRNYVLDLLEKQKNPELSSSITALFTAKKEEMHLGGLDLLVRLKKDPKRNTDFQTCCTLLSYLTNPTEKEAIIISELTNSSQTDSILNQKGYGLYNPDVEMTLPIRKTDPTFINQLFQKQKTDAFPNKKEELFALLDQLETLYTQNQNLEYKTYQGEERLLDNIFCPVSYEPSDYLERYPFPELWRKFYYEQIKDFSTLVNLYFFVQIGDPTSYEQTIMSYFLPLAKQIYGDDYLNIDFDFKRYPHFNSLYRIIYNPFHSYSKQEDNRNLLLQAACSLFTFIFDLPVEESIYIVEKNMKLKLLIML